MKIRSGRKLPAESTEGSSVLEGLRHDISTKYT